ncbi:hypothetical protein QA942_23115 [Streptomyces sp. B21-106]
MEITIARDNHLVDHLREDGLGAIGDLLTGLDTDPDAPVVITRLR